MNVAYLINQYPKVSHTFIRREIAALERQGVTVQRFALRGWDAEVADPEDAAERERTQYLLRGGMLPMLVAMLAVAITRPIRFFTAFKLAWRMGRLDHRLPYHVIYLGEACWLLRHLHSNTSQLHAHFGTNAAEVVMLCHVLGGPPYSFTVHGPEEFDKITVLGLTEKMQLANAVIAISSFGRSQLWRRCESKDWPKIHVVHCGLEQAFFGAEVAPVSPSTRRLLCIGRLCEAKGQLLLIEAAAMLAAGGLAFELVLAGDGEMRPQIEAAIARHDLQSQVRITGWIGSAQVRAELIEARALILTTFAEGLPVVIMEALAMARPVLTTYIAGIPELVRNGQEGWLFEAGSVAAAAAAMRACLGASVPELQAMGLSGRERVIARHHIDTEAARLLTIWRELHAPPAPVGTQL